MKAKKFALCVHFVRAPKDSPRFKEDGKWTKHFDDARECLETYKLMRKRYDENPDDYAMEPTLFKRCDSGDIK